VGLIERVAENGIVGAGGAGFPAAVKLKTRAETVIVNGAECEPLLHKDKELLKHHSQALLAGVRIVMEAVGAAHGILGIKGKYADVITEIEPHLTAGLSVHPLADSYPTGDEFILVKDVTRRVIPPGGLPGDVGAVVFNVETLVNIGLDRPVTHKHLTVAGAVAGPVTLRLPVGLSIGEAIAAAGGATVDEFGVLVGGVMMARLADGLDEPITKTTGGIVVLPRTHRLLARYAAPRQAIERINRSACDQCRFCTELCPRYLLGHPVEPHRAMLAGGFAPAPDRLVAGALYCCECNLCTLYSCPEDLDPKSACAFAKPAARERGLTWQGDPNDVAPHALFSSRRVPTRRLKRKLGLEAFADVGALEDRSLSPRRVVLPLKQHAGPPALPTVRSGERVAIGDLVAAPAAGTLGASIHASISGRVQGVDGAVTIET